MSQRMKQPIRRAAPIIDQDGREIAPEQLGPEVHGFRFDFGNSSANAPSLLEPATAVNRNRSTRSRYSPHSRASFASAQPSQ